MTQLTPEEIELNKKLAVLDRLKDRLADREEDMTDLRGELDQFEARYTMEVGRLYADLDEIDAQIAEEEYKLVPDDEEIKKKAEELRRKAEESAARADDAEQNSFKLNPTPEARKAYHQLARTIHPDLALDTAEKERRHALMAELNQAYSAGDLSKLDKLVDDLKSSPDQITGDSIGDRLVRAIRQISQVRRRLVELKDEMAAARASELFTLRERMQEESSMGRDMLKHMAARTVTQIKKSERRLAHLKTVNAAAEEYVKDKYGMDITAFRQ
jgi:hypothetical protein